MTVAESILRDLIDKIASEHEINNYELNIKAINSGGGNYTSALFLVTVKCPGKKDVELFAKVANMGQNMREVFDAKKLYRHEEFFYTKLYKVYKELELKANVADKDKLVIPKFYGCNTTPYEETVILQNLAVEGYKNHNRFELMDWEHVASSFQNLAKFHALSFAYQKKRPEEFEEVCKDLVARDIVQNDLMKELIKKQITENLALLREEYRPRVAKLLEDLGEDGFAIITRPLGTKVLIHGDFRPGNLMYRKKDNKVKAIILDYQTVHVGCPIADLLYFESCSTDSKFRAEYHDRLMDHYYSELSSAMQRLGVDPTEAYSREMFDSELKQMMPWLIGNGMFLLRLVLVDTDHAPKSDGDAGVENFMNIPASDLFAERFREVVDDCVKWGLI